MSELKAFNMPRYAGAFTTHKVYLKSEADAYIAELEEKHKMEVEQLLLSLEQTKKAAQTLRKKMNHQKRKRCLAMAEICLEKSASAKDDYIAHRWKCSLDDADFYIRWHKRWLDLAEKFKEAK